MTFIVPTHSCQCENKISLLVAVIRTQSQRRLQSLLSNDGLSFFLTQSSMLNRVSTSQPQEVIMNDRARTQAEESSKVRTINLRIEGAREAMKRTRVALFASTIASLSIFVAEYNGALSWYYHRALDGGAQELRTIFVGSDVVTVSALGIRIAASDLSILGSLTLAIFAIWLFFNVRRANHVIGSLFIDTKNETAEIQQLVYYGISSFLVFTTVTKYDSAISSLERTDNRSQMTAYERLVRYAVIALYTLPAALIAFIVITDLLTLFALPAAFCQTHTPLWNCLSRGLRVHAVGMDLVAILLLLPTVYMCRRIVVFEKATQAVIREYVQSISRAQFQTQTA